jgi:hypothetical protein
VLVARRIHLTSGQLRKSVLNEQETAIVREKGKWVFLGPVVP